MLMETNVKTVGEEKRLSHLLGNGFTVIGLDRNPAADVHLGTTRFWAGLPTTFVQMIGPEGTLPAEEPACARAALDVDGRFSRWCREQNGDFVVVRPDRYVFGVYQGSEAALAAADLKAALNGNPPAARRTTPVPGPAGWLLLGSVVTLLLLIYVSRKQQK